MALLLTVYKHIRIAEHIDITTAIILFFIFDDVFIDVRDDAVVALVVTEIEVVARLPSFEVYIGLHILMHAQLSRLRSSTKVRPRLSAWARSMGTSSV